MSAPVKTKLLVKRLLIIAIIIVMLLLMGRVAFVYCIYLNNTASTPYVHEAVEDTLVFIGKTKYSAVKDKNVYADENEYNQIRRDISGDHSIQIVDWDTGGYAYVDLDVQGKSKYQLLVIPDSYWTVRFKVFLFRESKKDTGSKQEIGDAHQNINRHESH